MGLTATPSGAAAQTLASPTSRQGLDREVRAALLRVRTRPKCPEGNLRGLTRESNPNRGTAREKKKKKRKERETELSLFPFPYLQEVSSTIKRNHKLPAYRKATPNTAT